MGKSFFKLAPMGTGGEVGLAKLFTIWIIALALSSTQGGDGFETLGHGSLQSKWI